MGRDLGKYLDLGFRFAFSILLCFFCGYWLDSKFGVAPLFIIVGTLLGLTLGIYTVYRVVYPDQQEKEVFKKSKDG